MIEEQTKTSLLEKQAKLQQRLDAIKKDLQEEHSKDWEEQAQERENDEVLEALAAEVSEELKQIAIALNKIDSGDYGICSGCGEDIAKERLEVLPDADLCIKCANAA